MFMTEKELVMSNHSSYLYRDLPYAVIFYREMKRKDVFKKQLNVMLFNNFFHRFSDNRIEVLFPDNSTLLIELEQAKVYVSHPNSLFFEEFIISV